MLAPLLFATLLAIGATAASAAAPKSTPGEPEAPAATASGVGFVIPRNTCEQGTPLQVFKPKAAASASRGQRAP